MTPALDMGRPGHFRLLPQLDPSGRGQLAAGHTQTSPCAACDRPRVVAVVAAAQHPAPAPKAQEPRALRATEPPPVALLPSISPASAERPTVPARGDRVLPPTLRPVVVPAPPASSPKLGYFNRPLTPMPPPPVRVAPPAAPREPGHLTVRESILLALVALGEGPHDVSVLVVRAWKMFPERFGLRGYADTYPDANRVQSKLAGADGLVGMGWVARVDGGLVEVTKFGARRAKQLTQTEAGHGGR